MTALTGVQIVTNAQAGNFTFDGAYIIEQTINQGLPQGPSTNQIGKVGTGSWGKPNTPINFGTQSDLFGAFGNKTTTKNSLVRSALSSMPDCSNFWGTRVTDGTDVAAIIKLLDTATPTPAVVLNLTAVSTGSLANGASARADLTSGTLTTAPIFSVTIYWPFGPAQVWSGIIGYATANGPYAPATFQTNAIAAINGTAPKSIASPYFIATAGPSTATPLTGNASLATGSGGTDGDSGVTTAMLLGVDAQVGSTGLYTLRGLLAGGQIELCGCTDPTAFQPIAAFAQQEGCIGWLAFPQGTSTASAIQTRQANNLNNDFMMLAMDWQQTLDQYQAASILVPPAGKGAGIVAAQPPYMYVGNKPDNGTVGVTSTERMQLGVLTTTEAGQREQNGINWVGKTQNGVMGLAHGLTSSGRQLNEIRMTNYIAFSVGAILNRFVGKMLQTTIPFAQADENDARVQCASALRTFFQPMLTKGSMQISAAQVILNDTNNPAGKMQQGFLVAGVLVTTLTGVQFAVGAIQVGNTVQIMSTPVSGS